MKVLIVSISYHRMNTERVARAMAEATGATLMGVGEAQPDDLAAYDLVGFGSGIYGSRHHRDLLALVTAIPAGERDVFIFSTAARPSAVHHSALAEILVAKGCRIVAEFRCRGEFRLLGPLGLNRGHPDEQDLKDARRFARGLVTA